MNLPKVSIITTSYTLDRLKDITELLDGMHAQTYKNIETLVITERSPELNESIKAYDVYTIYCNCMNDSLD